MDENLKRWAENAGINSEICLKSFRKTIEGWLVSVYPEKTPFIYLRQGHTETTSLNHYLNLPFTEEDKRLMEPYVNGIEW